MSSLKDQRVSSYANTTPRASGMAYSARGTSYASSGAANGSYHADSHMATLASGLGGMNLHHAPSFASSTRSTGTHMSNGSSEYNSFGQNQPMWVSNPPYMYAGANMMAGTAHGHNGVAHGQNLYSQVSPYMQQAGYPYGHQVMDNSPVGRWSSNASNDVPNLLTPRRESLSSNEAEYPGTPVGAYNVYANPAVMDRSPSAVFTNSATPSPSQMAHQYGMSSALHKVHGSPASTLPMHLQMKLQQDPAIPPAIPAPSSPLKPLDRSLENKNGETNVYIRGLLPETTDEMLYEWGKRFGDIQSSKSIIDLKTNLCKGFGFIKYHNFEDAENCIRGFHHLGYEVSFARESFYAKLKKFSDENNTNLYVSNIPRTFNEHELANCFTPYKVCSSRILRDANGNGRGVGFARFETREICEEVIKRYNNTAVRKDQNSEEHLIQIRYSDTHEQKVLKQQTAAGRQFRAAEYDLGVAQARSGFGDRYLCAQEADAAHEFENFLRGGNNYVQPATTQYASHLARTTMAPQMGKWAPARTQVPGLALNGMAGVTVPASPAKSEGTHNGTNGEARTNPTTPVKVESSAAASDEHA